MNKTPKNEDDVDVDSDVDTNISALGESDNTFDVELESLDDFLKADSYTPSDDVFPLEEEDLIPLVDEGRRGASFVFKMVIYLVFLAFLGGLGYVGIEYVPQWAGIDGVGLFKQDDGDRVNGFSQEDRTGFLQVTQEQEPMVQPMPMASDVISVSEDDFVVVDADTPFSSGFDEGEPAMDTMWEVDDSLQASNIANIVEITQAAITDPETVVVLQEPVDVFSVTEADIENIFTKVPTAPSVDEFILPPVDETPLSAVAVRDLQSTQKTASEPMNDVSVVDVPEVKAVAVPPVRRQAAPKAKVSPKAVQVEKIKPAINAAAQLNATNDMRIVEGRTALRTGDFARAIRIFDSILREDPAHVHALTGKQMAVSKVRYIGNDMTVTTPVVDGVSAPVTARRPTDVFVPRRSAADLEPLSAPVINTTGTTHIQRIMAQAEANPRDASLALGVGDAFRAAGDRARATEWYRKALQLDAVYGSAIDRMSIYDRLATVQ